MATILSNPVTLLVALAQPAWVKALASTSTWAEVVTSPIFSAWLGDTLTSAGSYRGTGPFASIRNAFCTPAWDSDMKAAYLFGGGHSDGSCNAVIKFDANALVYTIVVPPTPPSAYPPAFTQPNSPIVYPSGSSKGYFQTIATLTDPRDIPYAAPFAAPPSTHTYSGIAAYNGKLHLYYGNTATADLNLGQWDVSNLNVYGPQMAAINSYEGSEYLHEGTQALIDSATGKAWVCANGGSAGDNGRTEFVKIAAGTRVVEAVIGLPLGPADPTGFCGQESMCFHGRRVYAFSGLPADSVSIDRGWFCELDGTYPKRGGVAQRFNLVGDIPRFSSSVAQESVPCFSNGSNIYLWNYATERDTLYRINTVPTGGAGTGTNPYLLTSTKLALPTSTMPATVCLYRMDYVPEWGLVLVLPNADARWWALKVPA